MNAPMPTRRHRSMQTVITVAVVVALLAPLWSPLVGGELWGWLPDHGHAARGGPVGTHTHPWEARGGAATSNPDGLVFTAGDLLGAPAVPVAAIVLLLLPHLVAHRTLPVAAVPVGQSSGAPEPPPPR